MSAPARAQTPVQEPSAPAVELAPVVVKGARLRLDTLAEQVRKAMQPQVPRPAPAGLDRSSRKMQSMATWMSDPDAVRHAPGDHRFDTLPPPGDETGGCGADLTVGCSPR